MAAIRSMRVEEISLNDGGVRILVFIFCYVQLGGVYAGFMSRFPLPAAVGRVSWMDP